MRATTAIIASGIISTILLLYSFIVGGRPLAGTVITAGLLTAVAVTQKKASRKAVVAGLVLVLVNATFAAFDIRFSFAGVTHDTYLHLCAGFIIMLLATPYAESKLGRTGIYYAAAAVFVLGLGVELVQAIFAWSSLAPACATSFCSYWQDVVKDVINDTLGIALYFLAR